MVPDYFPFNKFEMVYYDVQRLISSKIETNHECITVYRIRYHEYIKLLMHIIVLCIGNKINK